MDGFNYIVYYKNNLCNKSEMNDPAASERGSDKDFHLKAVASRRE